MYQSYNLNRTCKTISSKLEDELNRAGLFFRLFSRVKTNHSINDKKVSKGESYYDGEKKSIRDIIGLRVILYFSDDVCIVQERLKKYFKLEEETVDENKTTEFAPTRINLVFRLPDEQKKEFEEVVTDKTLDSTFEVQIRTILSEGWHEIEHDLRYKCKDDWEDSNDLSRSFNGILATLEISEFSTLSLFDQLSHRHYKDCNCIAMFKTKFRLRIVNDSITDEVRKHIEKFLLREFFKLERMEFIKRIFESNILTPLTLEVIIFLLNYWFIKDEVILSNTPKWLLEELGQ